MAMTDHPDDKVHGDAVRIRHEDRGRDSRDHDYALPEPAGGFAESASACLNDRLRLLVLALYGRDTPALRQNVMRSALDLLAKHHGVRGLSNPARDPLADLRAELVRSPD